MGVTPAWRADTRRGSASRCRAFHAGTPPRTDTADDEASASRSAPVQGQSLYERHRSTAFIVGAPAGHAFHGRSTDVPRALNDGGHRRTEQRRAGTGCLPVPALSWDYAHVRRVWDLNPR
ncbi:hypothetical protein GCM10010430_29510 [Kitasatospora cystarginea]|uniref:Uncharacterized protein n=1 Tax=Kitasatospora cystarginea TaxID=58350 RepID=A0ABN3E0B7_9ACTN